ncbi:glycosyltransferase [Mesorhizobium sp. M0955]|uniref:glycosyltransferase family 2 protein n=1 Tax=Mesorhizobium sp. M0955 TaxID=2957033 RepID=UPI00333E083C
MTLETQCPWGGEEHGQVVGLDGRAKRMKISVLTVCRNSADTIRHTLDSFFAQEFKDKELIVVDGASTDETLSIIRSYPQDRMVVVSESDSGMYEALNKALRFYKGDAVGVLNSDDAFHDTSALARISNALSNADIVQGHLNFVTDHSSKRVVRKWTASPRPASGFRSGWMPAHPTFYVRRKVTEAVGEFNTQYKVASDYDWMLRSIELHPFILSTVDGTLVDMMIGGESTRNLMSTVRHNLEALHSRRTWLGSHLVDFALVAKPLRKLNQFIWR